MVKSKKNDIFKNTKKYRIFAVAVYDILRHQQNMAVKAAPSIIILHMQYQMVEMDYINELHDIYTLYIHVIAVNKINLLCNNNFYNHQYAPTLSQNHKITILLNFVPFLMSDSKMKACYESHASNYMCFNDIR